MQFITTAFLALLAALPSIIIAAPNEPVALAPRQQYKETIYLTNCGSSAEMNYYATGHNHWDGSGPDDTCVLGSSNGLPIVWEGKQWTCQFGTNVQFKSNIEDFAGNKKDLEYVGYGENKYHKYSCFKDTKRVLYKKNGVDCKAIYFCTWQ